MPTARTPWPHGYAAVKVLCMAMAVVVLSLLVGCRGQSASSSGGSGSAGIIPSGGANEVKVTVEVAPHPPAVGPAELAVHLVWIDGTPITDASVDVEGTMSHAGMVPVLTSARHTAKGRYVADDFRFTMGGDWIIIVRTTLADGQKIERHFDVKGVTGGKMHSDGESEGHGGGGSGGKSTDSGH